MAKRYDDKEKLRREIEKSIDFYNNKKLQATLKGMTPTEFRNHANPNLSPLII